MLAPKSSFPASLASSSSTLVSSAQSSNMAPRRVPAVHAAGQAFASPTESEFSDVDGPDAVKNWSEDQVCDYLRSVKCGEYEKIFRKNNVNGENLLEMDKEVLKEMGIDKVGDRVRLFLGIKKLRTKAYANQKRRNRVSCAKLYQRIQRIEYVGIWSECLLTLIAYRIHSPGSMLNTLLPLRGHPDTPTLVVVPWADRRPARGIPGRLTCQVCP